MDRCWSQKVELRDGREKFIKAAEMEDAKQAYEHARETYRKLLLAAADE